MNFLPVNPPVDAIFFTRLLGIDRLIEVRQRFIDTRRIAKREQGRIRAHQNSLRYNAQNVNEAEIARIEAKLKDLEAAYGAETGDTALIAEWVQHQNRLQKQLDTLTQKQNEVLSGFKDIAGFAADDYDNRECDSRIFWIGSETGETHTTDRTP